LKSHQAESAESDKGYFICFSTLLRVRLPLLSVQVTLDQSRNNIFSLHKWRNDGQLWHSLLYSFIKEWMIGMVNYAFVYL